MKKWNQNPTPYIAPNYRNPRFIFLTLAIETVFKDELGHQQVMKRGSVSAWSDMLCSCFATLYKWRSFAPRSPTQM
jgi:hypothetical protein